MVVGQAVRWAKMCFDSRLQLIHRQPIPTQEQAARRDPCVESPPGEHVAIASSSEELHMHSSRSLATCGGTPDVRQDTAVAGAH
jgi:hypothetical protein